MPGQSGGARGPHDALRERPDGARADRPLHRGTPDVIETGGETGRTSRGPRHCGGIGGDLQEHLHRGEPTADDEHALPGQLLGPAVGGGVELLAGETVPPRNVRDVGMVPGAGRGNDHARQPGAPPLPRAGLDRQKSVTAHGIMPAAHASTAAAGRGPHGRVNAPGGQRRRGKLRGSHRGDMHRTQDAQPARLLIASVVPGDGDVAGRSLIQIIGGELGQVGDPMRPTDRQGVPAVAPGASGTILGVEHEQLLSRNQPTAGELARHGQPGLTRPDDDDVDNLTDFTGLTDVADLADAGSAPSTPSTPSATGTAGIGGGRIGHAADTTGVCGALVGLRGVHITIMRYHSELFPIEVLSSRRMLGPLPTIRIRDHELLGASEPLDL